MRKINERCTEGHVNVIHYTVTKYAEILSSLENDEQAVVLLN